jgi:hypothetical protein
VCARPMVGLASTGGVLLCALLVLLASWPARAGSLDESLAACTTVEEQRRLLLEAVLALDRGERPWRHEDNRISIGSLSRREIQAVEGANGTQPLEGQHFRIGVVVDPPLVIRDNEPGGVGENGRYSGMIIDILKTHR